MNEPRREIPLESGMVASLVAVAAWGLILTLGVGVARGWPSAMGAAVGSLAATANLLVFALVGRGMLHGGALARKWAALAFFKFIALLAGGYLLLVSGLVPALALALGYGALPLGIATGSIIPTRGDDPFDPAFDGGGQAGGDRGRDLVTAAPSQRPTD